jgi:hypothetical protein
MKKLLLVFLLLTQSTIFCFSANVDNAFIQNSGQWDKNILFMSSLPNTNVWITTDGIVFDYKVSSEKEFPNSGIVVKMKFENTSQNYQAFGINQLQSTNRYIQHKSEYTTNLFKKVLLKNVYDGIDVVFVEENGKPRYDYIVKPNINPNQIAVKFEGQETLNIHSQKIDIQTMFGTITNGGLKSYQFADNSQIEVASKFIRKSDDVFAFEISNYDASKELIIDPIVSSTFFGTAQEEGITSMTLDNNKNIIVVGWTNSPTFPTSVGSYKEQYSQGGTDAFVAKFSPDMKNLLFCTYLGGTGLDTALCVKTDFDNNIFIGGVTSSADFGVSDVAPDKTFSGQTDGFLVKLSSSGNRIFATYIGGTADDKVMALAVNTDNSVVLTGCTFSSNFPTTTGVVDAIYNSGGDAFVTKIDANGTIFAFSTYIGLTVRNNNPAEYDCGHDIKIGANGDIIVVGQTKSGNFPIFPVQGQWWEPAPPFLPIQNALKGSSDGFIARLNGNASTFRYTSYFGGNGDEKCTAIELTEDNRVIVVGSSNSTNSIIPNTSGYQSSVKAMTDCFIVRFSTDWKAQAFTFFGDNRDETPTSLQINKMNGEVYIAGVTNSQTLFTSNIATQKSYGGLLDGFITKFNSEYNQVLYSTFIGGSQNESISSLLIDENYDIYFSANTNSPSGQLPSNDGYKAEPIGGNDGYIAKLVLKNLELTTPQTNAVWCPGSTVTIQWNTDYPDGTEFEVLLSSNQGESYSSIRKVTGTSIQYVVPTNLTAGTHYAVKVAHPSGLESVIDNITVSTVGALVQQPTSTSVCAGETAMFTSKGIGEGVQYEWRKGNQILKVSPDSSLVLPNVTNLDAGNYSVTIRSSCGNPIQSQVVTLTVKPLTEVTSTPPNKIQKEGTTLSLCPTYIGLARSYQWYFNDASLGTTFQSECLTIPNINKNFQGNYYCVVTGECGSDTTATITVTVDSIFVSVQENQLPLFSLLQNDNELRLRISSTTETIQELSIISTLGQRFSLPLHSVLSGDIAIPTSALPIGYYALEIVTSKQRLALPFSVVR